MSAQRDRGSGSALALAVLLGLIALLVVAVPLYSVFASRSKLAAVADAAALAAADARSGFSAVGTAPEPCAQARGIAGAAGAGLEACEVDGLVVTVVVSTTVLGLPVRQAATAGPPAATVPEARGRPGREHLPRSGPGAPLLE